MAHTALWAGGGRRRQMANPYSLLQYFNRWTQCPPLPLPVLKYAYSLQPVLRIHDILVWIRIRIWIRGSMPLTNGSGSGSCYVLLLKTEHCVCSPDLYCMFRDTDKEMPRQEPCSCRKGGPTTHKHTFAAEAFTRLIKVRICESVPKPMIKFKFCETVPVIKY